MKNILLLILLSAPPSTDGWQLFMRTKFVSTYMKQYNEYFLVPQFDVKLKQLHGTEIDLQGHYIPFDLPVGSIVLSRSHLKNTSPCQVEPVETGFQYRIAFDKPACPAGRLRLTIKN